MQASAWQHAIFSFCFCEQKSRDWWMMLFFRLPPSEKENCCVAAAAASKWLGPKICCCCRSYPFSHQCISGQLSPCLWDVWAHIHETVEPRWRPSPKRVYPFTWSAAFWITISVIPKKNVFQEETMALKFLSAPNECVLAFFFSCACVSFLLCFPSSLCFPRLRNH